MSTSVAPIRFREPLARHGLGVPAELFAPVREIMTETRHQAEAFLTRAARLPNKVVDDAYCKTGAGRARNLDRIAAALGDRPLVRTSKVLLFRYQVARPHPLHRPTHDDEPLGHVPRDGVEFRFVGFGALANGLSRADDNWFLAVSDHAIGRLLQRSSEVPRAAMLAAHDALLCLNAGEVSRALERERLVLPTPSGAFLTRVSLVTKPPSIATPGRERQVSLYCWAGTFLSHEMMSPDQEREAARLIGRTPSYLEGPLCCPALREPIHFTSEMLQ